MEQTTDLSLNDVHEFTPRMDRVKLTPSTARRLFALSVRAEQAQELQRTTQQAFIEAVTGIFEDAGIQYEPTDRFNIDWRESTVILRPREE